MKKEKLARNKSKKIWKNLFITFIFLDFFIPGSLANIDESQLQTDEITDGNLVYKLEWKKDFSYGNNVFFSISPDGEYIVVGTNSGLFLFNQNGEQLWEKKEKTLSIRIGAGFGSTGSDYQISVLNDGTVLVRGGDDSEKTDVLALIDRSGGILWKKNIESISHTSAISLSPDGDYIGYFSDNGNIYLLNNKGDIIFTRYTNEPLRERPKIWVSNNGTYIFAEFSYPKSGNNPQYSLIKLLDKNNTLIYEKKIENQFCMGIILSGNGNYQYTDFHEKTIYNEKGNIVSNKLPKNFISTVLTDKKELIGYTKPIPEDPRIEWSVIKYDSDGNLIFKYLPPIKDWERLQTSQDASRLAFNINDKLYFFVLTLNPEYPVEESVNTSLPTFSWKGSVNEKYQINIDDIIYNVTGYKYTPSDHLKTGNHEWKVRPVYEDGTFGFWSKNSSFMITKQDKITEKQYQENLVTIFSIITTITLISLISMFLIRPYYKRTLLKKKMTKTPTDWCPHCKKFTGGAKTCPHCGKETLVSVTYDKSKKVKKK